MRLASAQNSGMEASKIEGQVLSGWNHIYFPAVLVLKIERV